MCGASRMASSSASTTCGRLPGPSSGAAESSPCTNSKMRPAEGKGRHTTKGWVYRGGWNAETERAGGQAGAPAAPCVPLLPSAGSHDRHPPAPKALALNRSVLAMTTQRTYRPRGGVLHVRVGVLLERSQQEAQPRLHQLAQSLHRRALKDGAKGKGGGLARAPAAVEKGQRGCRVCPQHSFTHALSASSCSAPSQGWAAEWPYQHSLPSVLPRPHRPLTCLCRLPSGCWRSRKA